MSELRDRFKRMNRDYIINYYIIIKEIIVAKRVIESKLNPFIKNE